MMKRNLFVCLMCVIIGFESVSIQTFASDCIDYNKVSEVDEICNLVASSIEDNYADQYIVRNFDSHIYHTEQLEDKFIVYSFAGFKGMVKEEKIEDSSYVRGMYSALGLDGYKYGFEKDIYLADLSNLKMEVENLATNDAAIVNQNAQDYIYPYLISEIKGYEKYINQYTDFNFFYRIEFEMKDSIIDKTSYIAYLDDSDILLEAAMPESKDALFQAGMERVNYLFDTLVSESGTKLMSSIDNVKSNEYKYGMMVTYMTTYTSNPSSCDKCGDCGNLQNSELWNNSEYGYYNAILHNDCADYVSQAMYYAGITEDHGWYATQGGTGRSDVWVGVAALTQHMVNRGAWSSISAGEATYGDIIKFYNQSHVVMITYKDSNGVIKYSGHTNDRLNCVTSANTSNNYYRVNF